MTDVAATGKIHYYAVDTGALKRLVQCAYMEKAIESLGPSKKNNTEEKLEKARKLKAEKMFKDNVPEDNIQIIAAQCAWVLQYWGNGIFSNYDIVDGLLVDEHGKSIYGYNKNGWADCVSHTELKIAPPLPEDF
jgi:L-fucose isomerase-like protein